MPIDDRSGDSDERPWNESDFAALRAAMRAMLRDADGAAQARRGEPKAYATAQLAAMALNLKHAAGLTPRPAPAQHPVARIPE